MSIEQVKTEWQKMIEGFSYVKSVEVITVIGVTTTISGATKKERWAIYDKEVELMDKFPGLHMDFGVVEVSDEH